MKSIGFCIGLLAIAVAVVILVRPGSRQQRTEIVSSDRPPVEPTRRIAPVAESLKAKEPIKDVQETPATELASTASEQAADKPATEPIDPRTKGVVIKKSSAAARAKGEITFDDLKFEIEKDARFGKEMLDEDVKSLEGLNVRLNGYILPSTLFKETDIDQFVLVRDNQECCFGPGAALFDCVIVEMQDGNTTDFVTRPVTVYGKLKIDTEKYKYPGGKGPRGTSHFAIFRLEGMKVK